MNTVNLGSSPQSERLTRATVDTTGNIVLDMLSKAERAFKGSINIGGAKSWSFSNYLNAVKIPFFKFTISVANVVQQLPANVKMKQGFQGNWDDGLKQWTPLEVGDYI